MRLRPKEYCPIHRSVFCCGREQTRKERRLCLGIQRVEDPHPRGYRELRPPAFGKLKRALEKVRKDAVHAREKALEAMNRTLPNIEESYLRQVELVPGFKVRVERIRQKRDHLQQGTNPSAMTAAQLEHFLDQRDSLRQDAEELKPEEFPKEVLDFFSAARRGGIPLEKFTSTLQEWLSQRGQLKNVRVTILN